MGWANIHKWIVRNGDEPHCNFDELQNIVDRESICTLTPSGNSGVHFSAISAQPACLYFFITRAKEIIDIRNSNGETALHWACSSGYLENVKILLGSGADPNAKDHYGNTILHFAVQAGKYEIVDYLLQNKLGDVHIKNYDNETALDVALEEQDKKIFKLLKKYKNLLYVKLRC